MTLDPQQEQEQGEVTPGCVWFFVVFAVALLMLA